MSIPLNLISIVSKISPVLGTALGGPAGSIVGTLISAALGVDLKNTDELVKKLSNDPSSLDKMKELELRVTDLQDAREEASKETGTLRFVRPFLAILAMVALFADIFAIEYVEDPVVGQILIVMLVFLVWDIRQIYKFYFGNGEEVSPFLFRKKK